MRCEKISSNERAKKSIREAIAKTLSDTTISEDDLNALKNSEGRGEDLHLLILITNVG